MARVSAGHSLTGAQAARQRPGDMLVTPRSTVQPECLTIPQRHSQVLLSARLLLRRLSLRRPLLAAQQIQDPVEFHFDAEEALGKRGLVLG